MPVHQHRASTTLTNTTGVLCPGEIQVVAQNPQQRRLGIHIQRDGLAVDVKSEHLQVSCYPRAGLSLAIIDTRSP